MTIERIEGAPDGVLAFRAVGKVEATDYQNVLAPAIESAAADQDKLRLVYVLGPELEGYSAGASWQDAKLGVGHLTKWERVAVVTDHSVMADAIRALGILMPGEVKVFPVAGLDAAMTWAAG
ncbi:MAG TPA: STAS/SEC14 domain-containing protein [Dehalococcoidia bacterium]|nr:STAS/SEC14 domain-containing protein [Dehalococcoidia bacterium]